STKCRNREVRTHTGRKAPRRRRAPAHTAPAQRRGRKTAPRRSRPTRARAPPTGRESFSSSSQFLLRLVGEQVRIRPVPAVRGSTMGGGHSSEGAMSRVHEYPDYLRRYYFQMVLKELRDNATVNVGWA